MAIHAKSTQEELYDLNGQTELEYVPEPITPAEVVAAVYKPSIKPKGLTIEEYNKRQRRNKEAALTTIPEVEVQKNRKKRGGRQVKLRKQRAVLLAIVEANPPPQWDKATKIWKQIHEIENKLKWGIGSPKKLKPM